MIPFPEYLYLGNKGIVALSPIAPVLIYVASGLVFITWWVLGVFLTTIGKTGLLLFGRFEFIQILICLLNHWFA